MPQRFSLPALTTLFFLLASPVHASRLSLVGAASLSTPESSSSTATYSAKEEFGAGALLEFGLVPSVGLELGVLWVPRKYDKSTATSSVTSKLQMIQVPITLKAYLANVLSFGFGAYYAKYRGQIETETRSPTGTIRTDESYDSAFHEKSDYGIVTSIGIYIPMGKVVRLIVDGRYNIGVKDNSTSSSQLKYNDIQVLAGVQLGF